MKNAIPSAALSQHIAFLGKTGSGKTSTAKLAIEQIIRDDEKARVCILDPIKSDWWGLTSSASGERAGLPFHILGGPHGHVKLHESAGHAIGEIVGSGALPLSIIDMADFGLGGLQRFFNDFAPALIRKARGVVYLVLEEAHEFAPKERAGHEGESMTLHFAKKLATAGRSKGIRLMVLTQRTQALHNALLGSCDTMIAHRLTAPADQKPVKDWLKGNMSAEAFEKVAGSLASLKTGTGWICSGEAQLAELVAFPPIRTYDNSATPTGDEKASRVKTAPVDQDKLRTIIGEAVTEAKANDPAELKKRIAELEKAARAVPAPVAAAAPAEHIVRDARAAGWRDGRAIGAEEMREIFGARISVISGHLLDAAERLGHLRTALLAPVTPLAAIPKSAPPEKRPPTPPPVALNEDARPPAEGLTGPMQRILDALAWWRAVGIEAPSRVQVAAVARYTPSSGAFRNPMGALNSAALINYPRDGFVELTAEGASKAKEPGAAPTTAELHQRICAILSGPERKVLEVLIGVYPSPLTREELAQRAGYEPTSGAFRNPMGALRTLGLIDYPTAGQAVALPILFVE